MKFMSLAVTALSENCRKGILIKEERKEWKTKRLQKCKYI